jgi:hypothetical protein
MDYYIDIDLSAIESIENLLSQMNQCYYMNFIDSLYLTIRINRRVEPEYLVIMVGIIKHIRNNNCVSVYINIENPDNNNYPQRMNFHKELGINCEEKFNRKNSQGRFVEITNINNENSVNITGNILKVIRDNWAIDDSIYKCLNYCLYEIVDNIEIHANSPIEGYTIAQNFPYTKQLIFVILDSGKGIHRSLIENVTYSNLSPAEALEYCIRERVTNGKGRGYGLFHTTRFIQENRGTLCIHSGFYKLEVAGGSIKISQCSYWQGTLIYVKINTNKNIVFEEVFGANIPETVANADDYIDNDLW